jgi:uncharacterized protein (TIGR03067 family)
MQRNEKLCRFLVGGLFLLPIVVGFGIGVIVNAIADKSGPAPDRAAHQEERPEAAPGQERKEPRPPSERERTPEKKANEERPQAEFAAVKKKLEAGLELEKLQGTWTLVSMEVDGKRKIVEGARVVVQGDKFISNIGTIKGTYSTDPTKKPAHLDIITFEGKTVPCIYVIDNDGLKLCVGGDQERPKNFATKQGEKALLLILKLNPRERTAEEMKADVERQAVAKKEKEEAKKKADEEQRQAEAAAAKKKKEEAKKKADEEAAAEEALKRPQAARAKLDLAKQLSNPDTRLKKFKEVIEKYPETEAAKEAATLLKKEGGQ